MVDNKMFYQICNNVRAFHTKVKKKKRKRFLKRRRKVKGGRDRKGEKYGRKNAIPRLTGGCLPREEALENPKIPYS